MSRHQRSPHLQDVAAEAIERAIEELEQAPPQIVENYANDGSDKARSDEVTPWLALQLDRFGVWLPEPTSREATRDACFKIAKTHQLMLYRESQVPRLAGLRRQFEAVEKASPKIVEVLRSIPKEAYQVLLQTPEANIPSDDFDAAKNVIEYRRLLNEIGGDQELIASALSNNLERNKLLRLAKELEEVSAFFGTVASSIKNRRGEASSSLAHIFDMSAVRRLVHDTHRLFIWSGKKVSTTDDGKFDIVSATLREAATQVPETSLRKTFRSYLKDRRAMYEALLELVRVLQEIGYRSEAEIRHAHDKLIDGRDVIRNRVQSKRNPERLAAHRAELKNARDQYLIAKSKVERGIPLSG